MNSTCYSYNRTVSISEVDEFFGEKTVHTESESIDVQEEARREEKRREEKREREQRDKELHGENFDSDVVGDIKQAPTLFWGSEDEVAETAGLDELSEESESPSESGEPLEDLQIDDDISYGRATGEPSDSDQGSEKQIEDKSEDAPDDHGRRVLTAATRPNHKPDSGSLLKTEMLAGENQQRAARKLLRRTA